MHCLCKQMCLDVADGAAARSAGWEMSVNLYDSHYVGVWSATMLSLLDLMYKIQIRVICSMMAKNEGGVIKCHQLTAP